MKNKDLSGKSSDEQGRLRCYRRIRGYCFTSTKMTMNKIEHFCVFLSNFRYHCYISLYFYNCFKSKRYKKNSGICIHVNLFSLLN